MFSQGARQAGAGIPAASSATQAQAIAVSRRPHEVLVRTFYELCEAIVVAVRHQCSDREGSDDANKGRYYRSAGIALHLRCGCPLCGCRRSHRAWGRRGDARTGHIYNGLRCLLCDPGIGRLPCNPVSGRDGSKCAAMIVQLRPRVPCHVGRAA